MTSPSVVSPAVPANADDRQTIKTELLTLLATQQASKQGAPLTNQTLATANCERIERLVECLEACNPSLSPLLYTPQLLDGAWCLNYSTAREIRSLDKLPLGLQVGRIYQIIDVASQSFINQAFVRQPLGLLRGYVKVTARFTIAKPEGAVLPDKRINVEFLERIIAIQAIAGINTPKLDPVKTVPARSPQGRVPFLEITYLDETLRIGRGGEGSLFVLSKADQVIP